MFESRPKKAHVSTQGTTDDRVATYLETLHSTQDTWFKEGSFQNIKDRMHLISQALTECRKVLDLEHDWGQREYNASQVSLALGQEYDHLARIQEGFAQKKEIEKQKEMPNYAMRGADNPYQTEPVSKVAKVNNAWDFLA